MPSAASAPRAPSALRRALNRALGVVTRLEPPSGSVLAARLARERSRLWLFVLIPCVWWIYRVFAGAGHIDLPSYGAYHDLLAEAFRHGKLYIATGPLPDPLSGDDGSWALDSSYYAGRYYIYWGPVPALLLSLVKELLGIEYLLGDQYVCVVSSCVAFWAGALIVERMATRLFSPVPRWLVVLAVLVLAFANPALHAVTTGSTYHAAIMAAQAWLLVGLLAAFDAVWDAGTPRARRVRLFLAGVAWSLALGSRVSVAPAIALFVVATAVCEGWNGGRARRSLVNVLVLGGPLAVVGLSLLLYNKARFDSYFEFGTGVQLSGYPLFRLSPRYLLPNLYSYALRSFETSCEFPYVFQAWHQGAGAFPNGFRLPSDYMAEEPVIGWLRAVPSSWLLPFAFLLVPRPLGLDARRTRAYLWCLVCFAALASLSGVVALGLYLATMRYLNDVSFGIVLLALLGGFALRSHRLGRYTPRFTSALFATLGVVSIVFGVLIGYQGYNRHFELFNAPLDDELKASLSLCASSAEDRAQ